MADPDKPCEHPDFEGWIGVQRLTDGGPANTIAAFSAEIRIYCAACGEKFRFIGCPAGVLPDRPAVSVDESELRAPIRPASSDPDFGLGIPGFAVRFRDGR